MLGTRSSWIFPLITFLFSAYLARGDYKLMFIVGVLTAFSAFLFQIYLFIIAPNLIYEIVSIFRGKGFFMHHALLLTAAMVKVDGHVSESEKEIIKKVLEKHFKSKDVKSYYAKFELLLRSKLSLKPTCRKIAYKFTPQEKENLLFLLVDLATVDTVLTESEEKLLKYVTLKIGVKFAILYRIIRTHDFAKEKSYEEKSREHSQNEPKKPRINRLKTAYDTLGISEKAANIEVKKAYRKLAKKYHPDLASEDKGLAKQKFQILTKAYELIKQKRKMK